MAICDKELLRLRYAGYILDNPDRSNACDLLYELSGFYYSKGASCTLAHVIQSRPWDCVEIEAYRKNPNALIYDKCCWQDVALHALAYIDRHLTLTMKEYAPGYVCDCWRALMNGFNDFLLELLAKMMFTKCNAVYYNCEENCCFCLDTSQALKPLRLIRR